MKFATLNRAALLAAMFLTVALAPVSRGSGETAGTGKAVQGVTEKEVTIGTCGALTGKVAETGKIMLDGVRLYFDYINDKGGISKRKLNLLACDDAYDPEKAIECFNGCLKDKVFVVSCLQSSQTIVKYLRMAAHIKMPMVGFFPGTSALYDFQPNVFQIRPSYRQEVHQIIDQLVLKRKITRIGLLYQSDAFGASIREATLAELKAHGLTPVVESSYTRDTMQAEGAFEHVRVAQPEALIMSVTTGAFPKIIQEREQLKFKALCFTFSHATDVLVGMGKVADNMIISQVVPPVDSRSPTAGLFRKLYERMHPGVQPKTNSFAMFIYAMVLGEALKRTGRDLTRTSLVETLESMNNVDLGLGDNYKVSFSPTNHVGWTDKAIYLATIRDGKLTPLTNSVWNQLIEAMRQDQGTKTK